MPNDADRPTNGGELQPLPDDSGEFVLYQAEDGQTQIDVRMAHETVWLSQRGMAALFQTTVPNVNQHLTAIYDEGELQRTATIKRYLIVQTEGRRQVSREVDHYNLDAILSVGYRVRSHRGTQFRIWATGRLREYLIKGFAMDDRRLKQAGGDNYFEELLARIRDIRSSERVFWRKVLDIYATSIDYDPADDTSQLFFQTVQNKMHWAAHGHTAAEIIHRRADAAQLHMGLTSWAGDKPRKTDVSIAKNYLSADEIDALNRIDERVRFNKGLYAWIGFRSIGIPYAVEQRQDGGGSRWNARRLWRFAIDGVASFSTMPLRIWSYLGLAISLFAFVYALVFLIKTLVVGTDVPGFPSLIISIMLLSGVQLMSLGVMGEYLGRMYEEVKARPLFIVAEEVGLEPTAGTRHVASPRPRGGDPAPAAAGDVGSPAAVDAARLADRSGSARSGT